MLESNWQASAVSRASKGASPGGIYVLCCFLSGLGCFSETLIPCTARGHGCMDPLGYGGFQHHNFAGLLLRNLN